MTNQYKSSLLTALLIHTLLWIGLGASTPTTDDLCYLNDAKKISTGSYEFNESPKSQRLGMIWPTFLIIHIFGDSPTAIVLFPFIFSLFTIFILHKMFGNQGPINFVAIILLACNTTQLTFSNALFPDLILASIMLFICYIFWKRESSSKWTPILAGILLVTGFFIKQLIVIIVPYLFFLIAKDLFESKSLSFHLRFIFTTISLSLPILLLLEYLKGDWMFMISAVELHHNQVFANLKGIELIRRLTLEPLIFLNATSGFWPLLLLAIPALIQKSINGMMREIKWYTVYLFVFMWIGTTSLESYAPILLLDRMWMPLIALLCYWAAQTIANPVNEQKWQMPFIWLSFIASAAISLSKSEEGLAAFYIITPLAITLTRNYKEILPEKYNLIHWLAVTPFLLLAIWFVWSN